MKSRVLTTALAFICAASVLAPLPVRADVVEARALNAGLIAPAKQALEAALSSPVVGQTTTAGQKQRPVEDPGLPTGFTYTLDANMAFAAGKTGSPNGSRLPGGIDAVVNWGISPKVRFSAGYYELSEYPIGFDTGTVPLYLQGLGQIGTQNLANPAVDATVKNKIFTATMQNLITIPVAGRKLPIVITPGYLARWGTIGGKSDEITTEYNGYPSVTRLRTMQQYLLAVTLPFLSTPRMFGTATVAPQWLVHPAGINQSNHAQIFEALYLEYRLSKKDTLFFQPSRLIDYLPSDPYPEYVPTTLLGGSHRFNKSMFVQAMLQSGAATNRSPYGITSVTCLRLPCASVSSVAPSLGGLHAAQFQVQLGIGSPSVIPL